VPDYVYRSVEITGTAAGVDEAIRSGIAKVASTERNLEWFEVSEIRGSIRGTEVRDVQVTVKVGLRLE
jgi:dodecin